MNDPHRGRQWAGLILTATDSQGRTVYALVQCGPTAKDHRGHWDLPGGSVDDGETPLEGAVREASEEAGITPAQARIGPVAAEVAFKGRQVTARGAAADEAFPLVTQVPGEIAGCGWFTAAEMGGLLLHPRAACSLRAAGVLGT